MAYYSTSCALCTDSTKRCEGQYSARDKGGRFRAEMYSCENQSCRINLARIKGQKQLRSLLEQYHHRDAER